MFDPVRSYLVGRLIGFKVLGLFRDDSLGLGIVFLVYGVFFIVAGLILVTSVLASSRAGPAMLNLGLSGSIIMVFGSIMVGLAEIAEIREEFTFSSYVL